MPTDAMALNWFGPTARSSVAEVESPDGRLKRHSGVQSGWLRGLSGRLFAECFDEHQEPIQLSKKEKHADFSA
jgi:hypothetical protein